MDELFLSERERQTPHDIIYMWNLNSDANEFIYKPETDSQTEQTLVAKGERVGKGSRSLGLADANDYIENG